jgi:hypothetical protein
MSKKRPTPQCSSLVSNNNNNGEPEASNSSSNRPTSAPNLIDGDVTISHEPPPYSSSSSTILNVHLPTPVVSPSLPQIDYSKYLIPKATVSKDGSTISTYHPGFISSPQELTKFIQQQATLPPLPYIHIVGRWAEVPSAAPDFDLKINMLPFFIAPNSQRAVDMNEGGGGGSWNYVKLVAENDMAFRGKNNQSLIPNVKGGLYEWASRFCKEPSNQKT